jgi:hypothetical protein
LDRARAKSVGRFRSRGRGEHRRTGHTGQGAGDGVGRQRHAAAGVLGAAEQLRALRAVGLANGLIERVDQRHAADLEAVVEQGRLAEDAGDDGFLVLDRRRPGRREDVAARTVEQAAADGGARDSPDGPAMPSMSTDAGENPAVADWPVNW